MTSVRQSGDARPEFIREAVEEHSTQARLRNERQGESPTGPSIRPLGLDTWVFLSDQRKGSAPRPAAALRVGFGAPRRRSLTIQKFIMQSTSDHTKISNRTASCQDSQSKIADVQPRPTTSKTPWTSRLPRYVLRRRKTGGNSGASNQSRVNRGVSGTREVPSYFLSQFRGSPEYPGRLGHTVLTPENPAVRALTRRTYPSRVFRGALDVVGRRGWSYV